MNTTDVYIPDSYEKYLTPDLERKNNKYSLNDIYTNSNPYSRLANLTLYDYLKFGHKCCNSVRWKESTTKFEYFLLLKASKVMNEFRTGNITLMETYNFIINERGKEREVKAHYIDDRFKLKVFCEVILKPITQPLIITNNSASQVGKGTLYAINEFKEDLLHAYRSYGRNFYVITFDFTNFFGSLNHQKILTVLKNAGIPDDLFYICKRYLALYSTDNNKVGVGIGGEPSQQIAIVYPSLLDFSLKNNSHVTGYGRYMDDGYIICHTEEDARYAMIELERLVSELDLTLNYKRVKTLNMSENEPVHFLKKRFSFDSNDNLVIRLTRGNVKRELERIEVHDKLYHNSNITMDAVLDSYLAWRSYAKDFNTYHDITHIAEILSSTFDIPYLPLVNIKKGKRQIAEDIYQANKNIIFDEKRMLKLEKKFGK